MELFAKCSEKEFGNNVNDFLNIFSNKKIIIWGAGKATSTLLNIGIDLDIRYIVDANPELHGNSLEGYPICSTKQIKDEDRERTVIIIMPYSYEKYLIAEDLISMGYNKNAYCFGSDYILAYSFFKKNKVILPSLDLFITSFCNLRCVGCIALLPEYKKNKHTHRSIDYIKKDIDSIFSIVDYIVLISFSTGEVMLHPDFLEIIEYMTKYSNQYRTIHLVTNGTTIPKQTILDGLSKFGCHIYISNYTHSIQERSKLHQLVDLLEINKISYSIFDDFQSGKFEIPKWNDLGDIRTSHKKSEDEKIELYHKCANHNCIVAYDRKIYACGSAAWGAYGGVYDADEGDYIDINSINGKADIVKFFLRASIKGYPPICDRCDGVGPLVNNKTIPAGIQIKEYT